MSILAVTVPATLVGTLGMSLYSMRRGVELHDDPEFKRRQDDPLWADKIKNTTATTLGEPPASARNAVLLFLLALVTIVVIAMVPEIRTLHVGDKAIKMSVVIQMMMLAFGGVILWRPRPTRPRFPTAWSSSRDGRRHRHLRHRLD